MLYVREWTEQRFDPSTGRLQAATVKAYYPDWKYDPVDTEDPLFNKPDTINDVKVYWSVPVYHVRVGGTRAMRFGLPETYAALDWSKAVKEDLENYATVKQALARFAFKLTHPGGAKGVAAARTKLGTPSNPPSGRTHTTPPPTGGSTCIAADGGGR